MINKLSVVTTIVILAAGFSFAQPDRSTPPELPPPKSLKLPLIEKFELSNGLQVVLMEKHNVPLVQLNVIVKSGAVDDPEGKEGLANITLDMMDEGAAGMDALELADAIDFLGAEISTRAGMHTSEITLHTPLSKFDESLKLLADILFEPAFPENELERLKKQRLTEIIQWHDNPYSIASIVFRKTLYGEVHPYGRATIGDESSIKGFTTDDIKNFYSEYFKASNAFVIVVGDVTKERLGPQLEETFGSWKKGEVKQPEFENARQVPERNVYLVDKPDAAQSVIYIGRIGVSRNTEDYYPILVMNTILGGSFSSRLNQNLREEHGYTYSAGTSFSFRPEPGPFYAASAVQTEVTDKSLIEFFKELDGILKPIPEEEVKKAKNYVALRFPGNFQTVSHIANELEEMVIYNLSEDYFDNYISNILSVTKDDVERVAKKYIVPDKMAVIVVGDQEKIEQGIKDLNLGNINIYTIKDVLGEVPEIE